MSSIEVLNSPLNLQVLKETFMNDMNIINTLLVSFQSGFESFEADFQSAQTLNDAALMSRLAHGLKGSAGNIRAELLSAKAAQLQTKIDQGLVFDVDLQDVFTHLAALNRQIDELSAS
jgi:HPt (histidine-containing phosphotransfer) domain-containing protein